MKVDERKVGRIWTHACGERQMRSRGTSRMDAKVVWPCCPRSTRQCFAATASSKTPLLLLLFPFIARVSTCFFFTLFLWLPRILYPLSVPSASSYTCMEFLTYILLYIYIKNGFVFDGLKVLSVNSIPNRNPNACMGIDYCGIRI